MSKLQLKAARDAIGQKNYDYACSLCEDILELDPENYTALVFSGAALKELERFDESKKQYQKAIKSQPKQLLAYQVISFHKGIPEIVGNNQRFHRIDPNIPTVVQILHGIVNLIDVEMMARSYLRHYQK
jgi:tetratricopeptide (TPR) repeat protein